MRTITEEAEQVFAVAWDGQFRIEGDVFFGTAPAGLVTSFEGCPIGSILGAI
jgi:hypothetical protein